MRYAKIMRGGILVKSSLFEGAKLLVDSMPEYREGYKPVGHYVETDDAITMVWDYVPYTDDELAEIASMPEPEPTIEDKAEAYDILIGEVE